VPLTAWQTHPLTAAAVQRNGPMYASACGASRLAVLWLCVRVTRNTLNSCSVVKLHKQMRAQPRARAQGHSLHGLHHTPRRVQLVGSPSVQSRRAHAPTGHRLHSSLCKISLSDTRRVPNCIAALLLAKTHRLTSPLRAHTNMRLQLLPGSRGHSELASGVSWSGNGDIYTASDDQNVQRWSERGEARGQVGVHRAAGDPPWGGKRAAPQPASASPTPTVCWPHTTQVCALDTHVADLHCFPAGSKRQQSSGCDAFALACTDGECSCLPYCSC
jgi:hypothetical protein